MNYFDYFAYLLSAYINKPIGVIKYLPIVALVIAMQEIKYLMFQSPKKQELEFQLSRSQLLQIYYGARSREYLLWFSLTYLAWSMIYVIYQCGAERPP